MITQEAGKLNQVIRESEEYRRYQEAIRRIKEVPELYEAMNAFRRRNYELQSYEDEVNRYHEICNLRQEFEKALHNPLVDDFLIAEQLLCRKMTKAYEMIVEGLELDYSYME